MLTADKASLLRQMAAQYETADFINGDPSWFMHQVSGSENQEVMGFIASVLSYGSRKQFMPRINRLLMLSDGEPLQWIREGRFAAGIADDGSCFYRLYTNHDMIVFFRALQHLIIDYGSMRRWVQSLKSSEEKLKAIDVVAAITSFFSSHGVEKGIIPKNTQSSCKRVCMFLRWMVRDASPVDLGLWTDLISKRSLIMPMDTHVVHEAIELGLLSSKSTSMAAAHKLSAELLKVFPDDPTKGDFALFGYGVNKEE